MERFIQVAGPAAALPTAHIDTDVIMPKVFLKGIDRAGLDRGVFHDLRFDLDGRIRPDFVLNRAAWAGCRFLVVGPNFGCGSSREHAVWGLLQYGIRALIGTSFAGIFADNCRNNGLLTITLDDGAVGALMELAADPARNVLAVDLAHGTITGRDGTLVLPFAVEAARREALMKGLDAIGATLERRQDVRAFESLHHRRNPWLA